MNPRFKDLLDALQSGDLDKVTEVIFSITRLQYPSEERYEFVIPGKPLFVTGQILETENYEIKEIVLNLHYPGWTLSIDIHDEETNVGYNYSVEKTTIEGIYVHD